MTGLIRGTRGSSFGIGAAEGAALSSGRRASVRGALLGEGLGT